MKEKAQQNESAMKIMAFHDLFVSLPLTEIRFFTDRKLDR